MQRTLSQPDTSARALATHVALPLAALNSNDIVLIRGIYTRSIYYFRSLASLTSFVGDLDSPEMLLKWAKIPFTFVLKVILTSVLL